MLAMKLAAPWSKSVQANGPRCKAPPAILVDMIYPPLSALAVLRTHAYAYPLLEVVHILGIALWLVGGGFALVATSGLLMFASQPLELIGNRAFLLKICLLALAAGNAAWFHSRGSLVKLDRVAKFQTLLSACIWVAVVACGRWIAYL